MKNLPKTLNRLGYPQIMDKHTDLELDLPETYRIYNRLPGIWIGGTEDGTTYLHVERLPADVQHMPKQLAQGDLDIQISANGLEHTLEYGIAGQRIICQLKGEKLDGLWLRVTFNDLGDYLLLVANADELNFEHIKNVAMKMARSIRGQAPAMQWAA
ncbi:MAG: hypothetical protein KDD15_19605 [Lewinella sp.]|nr:hypothetical protein [Lewinella sp.]